MAAAKIVLLLALMTLVVLHTAEADVHKGSCVWGSVDYKSNCAKYCKSRGYKNGHCGSAFNANCWCET